MRMIILLCVLILVLISQGYTQTEVPRRFKLETIVVALGRDDEQGEEVASGYYRVTHRIEAVCNGELTPGELIKVGHFRSSAVGVKIGDRFTINVQPYPQARELAIDVLYLLGIVVSEDLLVDYELISKEKRENLTSSCNSDFPI